MRTEKRKVIITWQDKESHGNTVYIKPDDIFDVYYKDKIWKWISCAWRMAPDEIVIESLPTPDELMALEKNSKLMTVENVLAVTDDYTRITILQGGVVAHYYDGRDSIPEYLNKKPVLGLSVDGNELKIEITR